MDKKNNKDDMNRLIDIMAEMLNEQRLTRKEINGLKNEMSLVKKETSLVKEEVVGLRHEQSETNKRLNKNTLAISELRLSVMS